MVSGSHVHLCCSQRAARPRAHLRRLAPSSAVPRRVVQVGECLEATAAAPGTAACLCCSPWLSPSLCCPCPAAVAHHHSVLCDPVLPDHRSLRPGGEQAGLQAQARHTLPRPSLLHADHGLQTSLQVITAFNIYFNAHLIFKKGEVWRLLTNFFFFGNLGERTTAAAHWQRSSAAALVQSTSSLEQPHAP